MQQSAPLADVETLFWTDPVEEALDGAMLEPDAGEAAVHQEEIVEEEEKQIEQQPEEPPEDQLQESPQVGSLTYMLQISSGSTG